MTAIDVINERQRERNRLKAARWRKNNPERAKASRAAYYKRHVKETRQRLAAWREDNKAHLADYQRHYRRNQQRVALGLEPLPWRSPKQEGVPRTEVAAPKSALQRRLERCLF